jgi:hypothetical protein
VPPMIRPLAGVVRGQLLRAMLARVRDDPWPHIAEVTQQRLNDRNVRPSEAVRLRELAAQAAARAR